MKLTVSHNSTKCACIYSTPRVHKYLWIYEYHHPQQLCAWTQNTLKKFEYATNGTFIIVQEPLYFTVM